MLKSKKEKYRHHSSTV